MPYEFGLLALLCVAISGVAAWIGYELFGMGDEEEQMSTAFPMLYMNESDRLHQPT